MHRLEPGALVRLGDDLEMSQHNNKKMEPGFQLLEEIACGYEDAERQIRTERERPREDMIRKYIQSQKFSWWPFIDRQGR
jgi:hypothetical protein